MRRTGRLGACDAHGRLFPCGPALPGLVAAYLLRVPRPRLVREPGEEAAGALLRTDPARAFAAARAG